LKLFSSPYRLYWLLLGIPLLLVLGHWRFGLFNRYNYLSAQWDKNRSEHFLILYGEPGPSDEYLNTLAIDYQFQYKFLGCNISDAEIRGIEAYNQVISDKLEEINGLNWDEDFMGKLEQFHNKIAP